MRITDVNWQKPQGSDRSRKIPVVHINRDSLPFRIKIEDSKDKKDKKDGNYRLDETKAGGVILTRDKNPKPAEKEKPKDSLDVKK